MSAYSKPPVPNGPDTVSEGSDAGEYVDIGTGKKNTKVDVCVNVGDTKMFLATIDLKKLGTGIKSRRRAGALNRVYVLGQSPDGK